jgi:redox-sensitive bicupin YhaK (pirin superfamily)
MWVPPDTTGVAPGYQEAAVGSALDTGEMVRIAGGDDAALQIHQAGAELWIAHPPAGAELTVPAAGHAHVFVARGSATIDGADTLETGDAARLVDAGPTQAVAGPDGAEVVVWLTT